LPDPSGHPSRSAIIAAADGDGDGNPITVTLVKSATKIRLTLALFVTFVALAVHAHPMPESTVALELEKQGVRAELRLPLQELEIGFGHSIAIPLTVKKRNELAAYVARHFSAIDPKGHSWRTEIGAVKVISEQGFDELSVEVRLMPPPNAPPRRFTLRCDVIVHQLLSHKIAVWVRRDWKVKIPAGDPVFAGYISRQTQQLAIDGD
jgi:hypothetical protein